MVLSDRDVQRTCVGSHLSVSSRPASRRVRFTGSTHRRRMLWRASRQPYLQPGCRPPHPRREGTPPYPMRVGTCVWECAWLRWPRHRRSPCWHTLLLVCPRTCSVCSTPRALRRNRRGYNQLAPALHARGTMTVSPAASLACAVRAAQQLAEADPAGGAFGVPCSACQQGTQS
jgi:hypothetical protein